MKIVSLLKHEVQVLSDAGVQTIPPSGVVAECRMEAEPMPQVGGYELVRSKFGPIQGLPSPEEGTVYLVSTLTAQAAAAMGRGDCIAPDTGPSAVRWTKDDASSPVQVGQVKYVKRFQTF